MKPLHRPTLFAWSCVDPSTKTSRHSILWQRPGGNVIVDPLPLSGHQLLRLEQLGGVHTIVATRAHDLRSSRALAAYTRARVCVPAADADLLPGVDVHWLQDGDEIVDGLIGFGLGDGAIALLLEGTTLILSARSTLRNAQPTLKPVIDHAAVNAVLVAEGQPILEEGRAQLQELLATMGEAQ